MTECHHNLVDGDSGRRLIGSLDRLAILETTAGRASTTVTALGSLVSVDTATSALEAWRTVLEGGETTLLSIDKLGSDSDLVLLQGRVHGIGGSKVDIGAVSLLGKVKDLDGTKLGKSLAELLLRNLVGNALDVNGEEFVTAVDLVGSALLLLLLLGLRLGHNLGLGGSRLGNVDRRSLGSGGLGAPLVQVVGGQVGPGLGLGGAARDGGWGWSGSLDNGSRSLGNGSSIISGGSSSSSGSTVLLLGELRGLWLFGALGVLLGGILLGLLLVSLLVVLLVLVLLLHLLLLDNSLLLLNYGLRGGGADSDLGLGGRGADSNLGLGGRGANDDLSDDGSSGANGDHGLINGRKVDNLGLLLLLLFLLDDLSLDIRVILEVAENVVQDVETLGLLGQEEGLNELLGRAASVGHLTEDLDHDSSVLRGLTVDVANQNLAVLEIQRDNLGMNVLFGAKCEQLEYS